MRELTFVEAINEALHEEMARDERVFVIGEDIRIGYGKGGPFGATNGLFNRFGADRVIDTPISESAIAGLSVGAALWGMRPIAEIMFSDFLALAMDHIANSAAKMRYAYAGEAIVPVVFRMAFGAGVGAALHHSQSPEAWITNVPGLKIVMPSTPYNAKGLLKSAIRDDNPVVFFEHKYQYSRLKGEVPQEEYLDPLGAGRYQAGRGRSDDHRQRGHGQPGPGRGGPSWPPRGSRPRSSICRPSSPSTRKPFCSRWKRRGRCSSSMKRRPSEDSGEKSRR